MSTVRSISIGLGLDASGFTKGVRVPLDGLNQIQSAAAAAQGSLGELHPANSFDHMDNSKAAQNAAMIGAQMRSAMAAGLAPLNGLGAKLSAEFQRATGAIVRLAQRIDRALRFQASQEALKKLQEQVKISYDAMATRAEGSLNRFQAAFLRIAPAVDRSLGYILRFRPALELLRNRGDIAERSISKIGNVSLARPISSAVTLGKTLAGPVASGANTAGAAVKSALGPLAAVLGIASAGIALANFFTGGIKSAMDLNETVAKTKEVFGDSTASVSAQAEEMAKKFGLPKGAILDAASSIGLIGQAGGQSEPEAAKMANTMSKLAADASSFYNVPLDVALEKIRSGLVGEAEPMRGFGVLLSETAVKQEALRLGLVTNANTIDERTKVAARASLIEKGLATASGDLERTQNSAANQFRKAGGGIENFATSIGTALMPAIEGGINAFNEFGATLIETFEANKGVVEAFANKVKEGFDFAGKVIRNFPTYWEIALIKFDEFSQNVGIYLATIPENLSLVGNYLSTNWYNLIRDGLAAVGALFQNLFKNIAALGEAIGTFLGDPTRGFEFNWTPMLDGFQATADKLPEMIKPALVSLQAEMDSKFSEIAKKEEARAKGLEKIGPKRQKAGLQEETKGVEMKLAAAVDFAGAESYSAIVKAQAGGLEKDGIKSVASNTKELVKVQKETVEVLKRRTERQAPAATFVF